MQDFQNITEINIKTLLVRYTQTKTELQNIFIII